MFSSTLSVLSSPSIELPPNILKMGSSSARKKRELPGSPWRPDRPRSCASMRRLSCLSVPMTWRPPRSMTSSFSPEHCLSNSAFAAWYASRIATRCEPSSRGPLSAACASIASTSSMLGQLPTLALASAAAFSISSWVPSDRSGRGTHAGLVWISIRSLGGSPFCLETRAGASFCITFFLAKKPAFPPRRMSVPRPAMLVEMVMAKALPACATISLSLSTFSGLALSSSWGTSNLSRSSWSCSDAWMLVVPMRMGWPLVCLRAMSPMTASHLPCCVRNVTSALSRRATGRAVGMQMTPRS
mmetsp:Transcript_26866/g.62215  ORF Transcript_26866/g.62215 Transcript_26866/m.62215 type:complete len:300 (-) Transcript_26866:1432-2331(-)